MPTKLYLPYRIRAKELSTKATITEPSPEARRARDDFAYFGKFVQGVDAMPHHQVWIDALITNQDSSQLKKIAGPNTAILAPRGSGKSTWYGLFVAWVLGHNPDCQIIYCAYSQNVSLTRSRLVQRIIQSDKYRQVFPEVLPGKRWAATDWEINKSFSGVTDLESDYSFLAVGAGGSITSKRCLVAGTIVETEIGGMPIEKFSNHIGIKVKTFNERSRQVEWRKVRALASRPANDIYEVRTSGGRSFCCTSDHPVYILGQGYTEASHLAQGDTVVVTSQSQRHREGMSRLPNSIETEKQILPLQRLLPSCEKNSVRDSMPWLQQDISAGCSSAKTQVGERDYPILLQSSMSWRHKIQTSVLQEMQCTDCRHSKIKSRKAVLFGVSNSNQEDKQITNNKLPLLSNSFQETVAPYSVLLKGLCQQSTFSSHDGRRQQPFQERGELHQRVCRNSTRCFTARQSSMCGLCECKSTGSSPHQPQPHEQSVIQFDNSLPNVPHQTPQINDVWQTDTISSVTKLCGIEEQVYDIEVEGTHNFFANGVLVHNSKLIVIDDPVKSSEAIANPEVREKLETNWNEVLRPTLIPGGRVIAVGTRFRADDLFATTYTRSKGWHVIEQSAIVEDPVTGREASYWPQRYPVLELQQLREGSPGTFSFQFQNKIIRISETSIDPDWIVRSEVPTDPEEFDSLAVGLDLSAGEKEINDFSAFVLGGRIDNKFYILDMRRGRWAGNIDKLDTLLDMCVDWGILNCKEVELEVREIVDGRETVVKRKEKKYSQLCTTPLYLYAEDVQYQASLAADFKHYIINKYKIYNLIYRPAPTKGKDKLARLRGVSGLFQNKMIVFNQYRALGRLTEELTNFGSIDHEDCADATVHLLAGIAGRPKLDAA